MTTGQQEIDMATADNKATVELGPGELTAEQEVLRTKAEKELWRWNLAMCILHGVQAILALGAGLAVANLKNFKTPLATTFPSWTQGYPQPDIQLIGYLPFVPVTSGFAFLSSIFHGIVLLQFRNYIIDLRQRINKYRWVEYSLSSSLMIALIATLFGFYDVMTLVAIMTINACMNLFGYSMELQNQRLDYVDWTNFVFGSLAGIVPWVLIIAQAAGTPGVQNAPKFVWAVIVLYFVTFNTFPINMILQYMRNGRYSDKYFPGSGYLYGEKIYQVLSLVAKSLLLWLVVGGANSPSEFRPATPVS